MDNPLDQTTLSTISLLESRLLRIEHVLHGHTTASHPPEQADSALQRIRQLEKRFSIIITHIRVYGELLKICKSKPAALIVFFFSFLFFSFLANTQTKTNQTPISSTHPMPRNHPHSCRCMQFDPSC